MKDIENILNTDSIEKLQVCYNDYSGRLCGKIVPKHKFHSAIKNGIVFAKANLSFGLDDHFADNAKFLANTGDFLATPDPDSYTILPHRIKTARVNSYMLDNDKSEWEGCPRTRLNKIVKKFSSKGIKIKISFEPEFSLYKKNVNNDDYSPISNDGMFTISGLDRFHGFWESFDKIFSRSQIKIEQLGKEYGPGQYEATWMYDNPIKSVDNYINYKDFIISLARDNEYLATFMPKPFAHLPGNGLHLHISLWDQNEKKEISCKENDNDPLSDIGKNFVAGLLKNAHSLTSLGCASVNSYKRILPGSWSPAHICWGIENRSVLVRIPGKGERKHIELRHGDNIINPHIYLTGVLAAGFEGIDKALNVQDPVDIDAGQISDNKIDNNTIEILPRNLTEALSFLKKNQIIREALGDIIFEEFIKIKETEIRQYEQHVHPWERSRYMENF
ncbi:MAG: Glutamine synthetase [Alphaproteobacteria bacterium MarineAlpha5_Bin11]|nr:MAG: Glutamine synthetase [Alphaproteobacteria bacterium MarineAlpha5_Bin11]PPR51710.1 MAG: Glutamine synthetase [Alphaproteobacteria bacterium MarineAlpha5_Bin10]|tara:strand:+ start:1746 stop:3083 length:1338 start_codon:yes stop_codon:yes gene_type:complete